jgi:protein-glutamine gamma-glutamyltransferase
MAAIASIAVDLLADPQGNYAAQRVVFCALWIIAAVATRMVIGRWRSTSPPARGKHAESAHCALEFVSHGAAPPLSKWWVAALAVVTVAPLAIEPFLRSVIGEGRPLEIQMVLGLRNLALGLAALSLWPACARLSAAVSLCLMLFAQVIDEGSNSPWLLGPFAVAGGFWLLFSYQASFADLVTAAVSETKTRSARSPRRLPWRGVVYIGLAVAGIAAIGVLGPSTPLASLGEWIGSSGGTGANDPYARSGVNDGQEEMGGENPETTGFAETDKFLDSDKPTLYDAASDMYGEPIRKKKTQLERVISVTPSDVREIKNHAENHRASREFAAARKSPKRPRKRPEDRSARALFEVQGRTPLHLRMDVLASYDGATWKPLASEPCANVIDQVGRGARMQLFAPAAANYYGAMETHKLKIASISGALSPTPTLLSQFRVGMIDRADYFEWRRDGVLGFRGRTTIPSGTTVETHCRTADLAALASENLADASAGSALAYRDLPEASKEAYAAIARDWAGDLPRGPAQVAAIIERIRENFRYDSQASVATIEGDPVLQFLQSKQSGPDYLFASAAVLLLRSQGYPARLALGYYASPAEFDAWTRHTPVRDEDMHFWPEILLSDGNWLALEPTPGYDALLPKPTWSDLAIGAVASIANLAIQHPFVAATSIVALIGLVFFRLHLIDAIRIMRLRLFPIVDWRKRVLASMQLIETRAATVGQGRAVHQTLPHWSSRFAVPSEDAKILEQLTSLSQAAVYSPKLHSLEVEAICRQAEQTWTLKRFREAARSARGAHTNSFAKPDFSTRAIAST